MTATASNLRLGSMMHLCGGHWRPFLPIPILSGLIDRCDTPVVLDRRRRLFGIETVSRLAMHRIIADQQHLVPHPQRDTEDVFDAEEDNTRPHDVPADDEQETDDLDPDLTAVVRDGPAGGVTDPEGGGPIDGCKNSGEESTENARDDVGVDDAEGVVDTAEEEALAEDIHAEPRNRAGDDAHDNGCPAGDNTGCGRDGDETGDHALHGAEDRGFLVYDGVDEGPGKKGGGGADVGIQHGDACIGICSILSRVR